MPLVPISLSPKLRPPTGDEKPWLVVTLRRNGPPGVTFHGTEVDAQTLAAQCVSHVDGDVAEAFVGHITVQGSAPMANAKRST